MSGYMTCLSRLLYYEQGTTKVKEQDFSHTTIILFMLHYSKIEKSFLP